MAKNTHRIFLKNFGKFRREKYWRECNIISLQCPDTPSPHTEGVLEGSWLEAPLQSSQINVIFCFISLTIGPREAFPSLVHQGEWRKPQAPTKNKGENTYVTLLSPERILTIAIERFAYLMISDGHFGMFTVSEPLATAD